MVDAVVGLALLVVANHGCAQLERLLGSCHNGQRVVVDRDQLERVVRDVRVLGDHARDLLALHAHLVGREHGLRVAGERRHPREVVLRQDLAGHHDDDAGKLGGTRRVDRVDLGVRERAAQDRHVQHVGQDDVVDVVALAADEPLVLLALDAAAEPFGLRFLNSHHASSRSFAAAHCTALTMFW